MFGALNSIFTFKLFYPSSVNIKQLSADSMKKPGLVSRIFADTDENIINVYSPVMKPESAIV